MSKESMRLSAPDKKRVVISLHIGVWIILFILPQILVSSGALPDFKTYLGIFLRTLIFAIIFYVNYLWLIPKFLNRSKGFFYLFSLIGMIFVLHFMVELSFNLISAEPNDNQRFGRQSEQDLPVGDNGFVPTRNMIIYSYFINAFLISGFAIGLKYSEVMRQNEKEKKELEEEKLNSELALLKNQISPHFFFNTLNNIYSLIGINTDDARESVLNLSKLMRYLLYESELGNTRLSREIDFMKNYIDLMKLRLSNKITLDVNLPVVSKDIVIPPLLFIPFVENAFKHGTSFQGSSIININMEVTVTSILFRTQNSKNKNNEHSPLTDSGIGLDNVRKRLNLLFPKCHELVIEETDSLFSVYFKLDIRNFEEA
jgi:two-component system LytT family sensor kinase